MNYILQLTSYFSPFNLKVDKKTLYIQGDGSVGKQIHKVPIGKYCINYYTNGDLRIELINSPSSSSCSSFIRELLASLCNNSFDRERTMDQAQKRDIDLYDILIILSKLEKFPYLNQHLLNNFKDIFTVDETLEDVKSFENFMSLIYYLTY